MSNNNSNVNGAGQSGPPTVHLILQGKGGIGRSVVESWLAEFLMKRGQRVRCIDGDPVNRSFAQYKAFSAEKLDLLNADGVLDRTRYDVLFERFLAEDAVFVVDSGATAFLSFWSYLVESDLIPTLRTAGRKVYVHVPIGGGEMLNDTLIGFKTFAEIATDRNLVVWIDEYFGTIARDGKAFSQMQVYLDNQDKVLTAIGIPQRSPDTFGQTTRRMREKKLTFEEAILQEEFFIVDKSRLFRVQTELFAQLEQTLFA